MKHLPLKTVMLGLNIIETDEGYELHSPAGEAKYDVWGSRQEVNGIPEYFPLSISVNKRAASKADTNITIGIHLDVSPTLEQLEALKKSIEDSLPGRPADSTIEVIKKAAYEGARRGYRHAVNSVIKRR